MDTGLKWTTADNRQIGIRELEDDHLWNIMKYCLAMGTIPAEAVLWEAHDRGFLHTIGDLIPARPGYKSPEQVTYEVHKREPKVETQGVTGNYLSLEEKLHGERY